MWLFYEVKIYTQTSRVSYRKVVKMEKQEALALMLNSINEDNRDLCLKSGMSESDAESQIAQSQPTLTLIVDNMYDRMKAAGIIA
jgi:hypothetical protein